MGKRSKWKKMRPESNQELEYCLLAEKKLTAKWYDRISGKVPCKPREREALSIHMDEMAAKVNALIAANTVEIFANPPNE